MVPGWFRAIWSGSSPSFLNASGRYPVTRTSAGQGVDAQHLGPERSKHPGPNRTCDNPGKVQHAQSRRRQRTRLGQSPGLSPHLGGHERRARDRRSGPGARPLIRGARRHGQTARTVDVALHAGGVSFGHQVLELCRDPVIGPIGHVERRKQRRPVPWVVGVGAHPAVTRRPHAGQRGEPADALAGRVAQPGLAAHRSRHVASVEGNPRPVPGAG